MRFMSGERKQLWFGRTLQKQNGLFNDAKIDHFIATKHGWAWAAVRQMASPPRVLETHAGYGWLTTTYAMAGACVVSIERNADAAELCRANTDGLDVTVICGDCIDVVGNLDLSLFDIIDIDPAGSPQPVLDQVVDTARPRFLFVTAGEGLHARLNRVAQNPVMLARYPEAWSANWEVLDRGAKGFGREIVFAHIQRRAAGARLLGYHVWPLTSSARLGITWSGDVTLPNAETASFLAWRMATGELP